MLHRALVEDALGTACRAGIGPVTLWCTPDPPHAELVALSEAHDTAIATQRGAGLGERMFNALRDGLDACPGALVIGSDCPFLTAGDLGAAACLLAEGRDAVVGPARDGGYYLLAVRRLSDVLFHGMDWGTSRVLQETRTRLGGLEWTWSELATKSDIDRPADLDLLQFAPGGPFLPKA